MGNLLRFGQLGTGVMLHAPRILHLLPIINRLKDKVVVDNWQILILHGKHIGFHLYAKTVPSCHMGTARTAYRRTNERSIGFCDVTVAFMRWRVVVGLPRGFLEGSPLKSYKAYVTYTPACHVH